MWKLALLLGLALSGCGSPAAPAGRQGQPIVGGVDDPGDPAVVALLADGWPSCSGTLVGPTAVLTAGHCANALGPDVPYAVAFGPDAAHPDHRIAVAEQVLHPGYTGEGKPYDFALLRLAEPATVAPVPLGTTPLTQAEVGAPIRHVGFGVSDDVAGTGRGTKRQVTYPITRVDPLVVWSGGEGQQTCNGDSGGGGLLARAGGEELVGVVSDGPDCRDAGWDGRVDAVAAWVASTTAPWAPDAGAPPPDAGPPQPPQPRGGCSSAGGGGLLALALLALARRR